MSKSYKFLLINALLGLTLLASVWSKKVLFADGVNFFLVGMESPVQFDPLNVRSFAIFLRNSLAMLYAWLGGSSVPTAMALFSIGAFLPVLMAVQVLWRRSEQNEAGAWPTLLALLAGVFLLINFPASELLICHAVTCLLVQGYLSGRAQKWPWLFASGIWFASFSYEVTVFTNLICLLYLAFKASPYRLRALHMTSHGTCIVLVLLFTYLHGVNANSSGVFSKLTLASAVALGAMLILAFLFRNRLGLLLIVCLIGTVAFALNAFPPSVNNVVGITFGSLSYESRGVSAAFMLSVPLLLWWPSIEQVKWPVAWRASTDSLIVLWATFQIISACAWGFFWTDFKAEIGRQATSVELKDCSACTKSQQAYPHGVYLGWPWNWGQLALLASLELGLETRKGVVLTEGYVPWNEAQYQRFWTRYAAQPKGAI